MKNSKNLIAVLVAFVLIAIFEFQGNLFDIKGAVQKDTAGEGDRTIIEDVSEAVEEKKASLGAYLGERKEDPLIKESWTVFQGYLKAAQAHDKETLRNYSYKLSVACEDPAQEAECVFRMDTIYYFGSALMEEYFKTIWYDDKQIVLTGKYEFVDVDSRRGYLRTTLLFTRDEQGRPRLVGFKNNDGPIIPRGDFGQAELDMRLKDMAIDSDKDALADDTEKCITPDPNLTYCMETDPNIRDSDSDGWWDGLEYFINKLR